MATYDIQLVIPKGIPGISFKGQFSLKDQIQNVVTCFKADLKLNG